MMIRESKTWFSLMFDSKCYIQHPLKPQQQNSSSITLQYTLTYCSWHHMVIRESKTWFSLMFDTKCYIQHPPKPQQHNSAQPPLPWRHNGHDCVSNHQPYHCLLNLLFERRSKKTSKLHVSGLVWGIHWGPVNSPHKWPITPKMFPFDDVIMSLKNIL